MLFSYPNGWLSRPALALAGGAQTGLVQCCPHADARGASPTGGIDGAVNRVKTPDRLSFEPLSRQQIRDHADIK